MAGRYRPQSPVPRPRPATRPPYPSRSDRAGRSRAPGRLARCRGGDHSRGGRTGTGDPAGGAGQTWWHRPSVPPCQFASGKTAAVALFSASSLALTKEVLRTMAMKRIAVAAWALIPAGVVVFAAGTMLGQEPGRKGGQGAAAAQREEPKKEVSPAAPVEKTKVLVDPLERELLDAARQRLEAQRAYYEEGRITIDRFIMGESTTHGGRANGEPDQGRGTGRDPAPCRSAQGDRSARAGES